MDKYMECIGTIKKYMMINHVTSVGTLAKKTGISEGTMYQRMKDAQSFRLCELNRIYTYLRVPADERVKL